MARVWGLILLGFLAGELASNSANLYEAIQQLRHLRHKLMVQPDALRSALCLGEKTSKASLFWNEKGRWVDVCQTSRKTGYLPRIWRIQLQHNYRMLFLREVPITFAIVIKR